MLIGRDAECEALDRLLAGVRGGRSGVVVLRGEPGAGKSALLNYVSDRAAGWRVARAAGVESEMELPYSGLHQLTAPMLEQLDQLPQPQSEALGTVFGTSTGAAPDRFFVGLAVLTLLSVVADEQPLVCIVDDAQWLDGASAQILGFVARRLVAERIAVVCAARSGIGDGFLAGLPDLLVGGLDESDARALLLENVHGPLDAAVCEQIVKESHGNPLALLELPRTWNQAELAGGFGLPHSQPVAGKIERSYARRLRRLPMETQLLVLAAAAEPLGDAMVLRGAAQILGVDLAAADAAQDAGLLTVATSAEFAHPLVRSAAYRTASTGDRRRVHGALADATDAETDPDRRAWHLARAATGPGEEVAAELERSAARAQSRGGLAAAAAFLQGSATLTVDPARRTERGLAAAQASFQAGAFDVALELLDTAEARPLDELQSARATLLRGQLAFASGATSDAPALLLQAARDLEHFDLEAARETYLAAWGVAAVAPGRAARGGVLAEISHAILDLPRPQGTARARDLLLDGLAALATEGRTAATPKLQQAAKVLADIAVEDVLRWGWMATAASNAVWDNDGAYRISARQVQLVRDTGALGQLPLYLSALALARAFRVDLAGAASDIAEADSVAASTGGVSFVWGSLRLWALRGREAEAAEAIASANKQAAAGADNLAIYAQWAAAVLYNGLSRYDKAVTSARLAAESHDYWVSVWVLPELVEAASREDDTARASDALERLKETTQPCGNDFALGIEARCRALLNDGAAADGLYREAIERLGRTDLRPELARTRLLYGEWLRREGRRVDAREQLRSAHDMFVGIGMEAFADRARRELVATGEKVRRRRDDTRDQLTPQEEQIARLARDGLSNPEIAAQLFLSARTVEWHLRKVFTKLGISSRRQLREILPAGGAAKVWPAAQA